MDYLSKLQAIKAQHRMTNSEIATRSGVPLPTVTKVLNGSTSNPSIDTLAQIAQALDTTLDELVGITPTVDAQDPIAGLLAEKDRRIAALEQAWARERSERHKLMYIIGGFFAFLITIIIIDMLNGGIGYIRY